MTIWAVMIKDSSRWIDTLWLTKEAAEIRKKSLESHMLAQGIDTVSGTGVRLRVYELTLQDAPLIQPTIAEDVS
jgi:hypothetical protein